MARGVEMLRHRKLRNVVTHAYTSQTFAKTTPEVSFSFTNVKNWASVAGYAAVNKIFRLVRMWKKMHFIWVSMYLVLKYYWGHYFLLPLLEREPPFYVVIQATRGSSRLQYEGSTFIPQQEPIDRLLFLSYFKTLSIGPAPGIEPAIPTERTLPRLKVLQ